MIDDDFEDYLRSARPAEPPPELMRRLRQAEPAVGRAAALRWWRGATLAAIAVAALVLLAMVLGSHRLLTEDPAAPRQHTVFQESVPADDERLGFGSSVALNIALGASPDLIPVSLRPHYDPRAPHSPAGLLVANPISESAPRF